LSFQLNFQIIIIDYNRTCNCVPRLHKQETNGKSHIRYVSDIHVTALL